MSKEKMKSVMIYTDGACSGNPGVGGWGVVLIYGEYHKELSGVDSMTTNNRMEMMAVVEGLKSLKEPCDVRLYSDSAYVVNAFLNGWLEKWQQNNWRKADNKEVLNLDLWQKILQLTYTHKVNFVKVKGHSDNKYNNRCDELARGEVDQLLKKCGKSE